MPGMSTRYANRQIARWSLRSLDVWAAENPALRRHLSHPRCTRLALDVHVIEVLCCSRGRSRSRSFNEDQQHQWRSCSMQAVELLANSIPLLMLPSRAVGQSGPV